MNRRNTVCSVKSPSVYLPDNFHDLDTTIQKKIFNQFMCPSSDPRFKATFFPVCSSQDFRDTEQSLSFLGSNVITSGSGMYYHLMNSYLRT